MQHISNWEGLTNGEVYQTCVANHQIWASTSNGIFVLPINYSDKKSWIPPQLYIKSIQIDGLEVPENEYLTLDYHQKLFIELETSAMASGKDYRFFYRIDKGKWETINPENPFLLINSLPKRNFVLEIIAQDHRNISSSNRIKLKIFVQPPFWETWWFYIFLVLSGGIIMGLFLQNRFRQIQKQERIQAERKQMEQELHISRLKALKAQMRPHFIFNVLNSIQSFIYQNKPKDAREYLGKFSKFMRLVLAHSEKEWISLEEELSMIQNYVELEAIQIEGEFQYDVQIDERLKIEQLKIPSFLLQPIVENVFKHAFKNKKDKKTLIVIIKSISDDIFEVIIEDNGIGRENALKNKQVISQKHHSFASNAIHQKIELLNIQNSSNIVLNIVDLKDEKENARGTRVCLQLKFLNNDF